MVQVPRFCSLRLKAGQISSQASLIPCWRHLLVMQISQIAGAAAVDPCGFRNGLSSKGLRHGRGSPYKPFLLPRQFTFTLCSHSLGSKLYPSPCPDLAPGHVWSQQSCEVESVCIF